MSAEPPATPPSQESPDQGQIKDLPGLVAFAVMGTTIASCVAVGVLLGIWADSVWHTAPAFLLIGLLLGSLAAVGSVVKQVRRWL